MNSRVVETLKILFMLSAIAFAGCSIPNLEAPECTQARDAVKRFYSIHFGNSMEPSPENLKLRQRFLTNELFDSLSAAPPGKADYFTATEDFPKAFRVGACEIPEPKRAVVQVLLFWRDDSRNEQKEIKVSVAGSTGTWLIDKVSN